MIKKLDDHNVNYDVEWEEGKDEVKLCLEAVVMLKEMQKAKHVCEFIAGKETTEMAAYKHDKLALFGKGKDNDVVVWNAVIRQCLVEGLLIKDIESYGVLKMSEKGREFIKKPTSFILTKEHEYPDTDSGVGIHKSGGGAAADEQLYALLVDLRKSISKEKDIPPFVIFQEPSLQDMAIQYPIKMDELVNIQGVGMGKAKRYGKPFLELIQSYVDENEIERPNDLVVKSVVNKSGLKVHIIQNVDRKMPLESIGSAKGIKIDAVIDEIEAIVASGTKVNINYYLDEIMDDDIQEEIYEYFGEAESDDLTEAYNEFDGDYSEEELRLMRIKFMSEMAN